MSNLKVRGARLEGHSEAKFPDSLSRFQNSLYNPGVLPYFRTAPFLEYFFHRIVKSSERVIYQPETSDGYIWHARADFSIDGAQLAILLPQGLDTVMVQHGTIADRHCALYARLDQDIEIEGWIYSHAGRYLSALLTEEQQEHFGHHRRTPRKIAPNAS